MWFKVSSQLIDFRSPCHYLETIDAGKITVEQIMKNYPPPYYIMCSGGVDSQAVLYFWKLFGQNFIPTTVSYNENLNYHDIKTIYEFADTQDISINTINFDALSFYKIENYDIFCNEYHCTSPHFACHLEMTKNLNGTVIFSGDRSTFQYSTISDAMLVLYRASQKRNIVPFFLTQTPELFYSFDYEYFHLKKYKLDLVLTYNYYKKVEVYQQEGIPVIPQLKKYTGFERIKDYYDDNFSHLLTEEIKEKYKSKASSRTYDMLLRYPYEDRFQKQEKPLFLFNNLSL